MSQLPIRFALITPLLCGTAACVREAHSEPAPPPQPKSLAECYLNIAARKTNADMAYIARDMCDAVFKPERRSLFVLEKSGACVEWWLDRRGRYESHEVYCALEPAGNAAWTLACQYKDRPNHHTLVELVERDDRYERTGELVGTDPGTLFKTMAACVRHKLRR
ncbi:MAG: hypothetical protein V3T05_10150 [Myxococcota bacterium]